MLQLLVDMQYVFVEPSLDGLRLREHGERDRVPGCSTSPWSWSPAWFFIGKSRRILRARFHDEVPLGEHRRFWLWGSLGILWALLLHYVVIMLVLRSRSGSSTRAPRASSVGPGVLVAGPLTLVLGFMVLFVVGQGLRRPAVLDEVQAAQGPGGRADAVTAAVLPTRGHLTGQHHAGVESRAPRLPSRRARRTR